jgi:hypothetical protein
MVALLGFGAVFAVTGCGDAADAPPGAAPPGAPSTPAATARASTPDPEPTGEPGFPTAADGTNVRACYDGNCEILVTKRVTIGLDPKFGFETFSFDPTDSVWRYTYPDGGSGSLSFLEPPYEGQWAGPSASQSLALKVVASQGSRAVISLRPVG